MQRRGFTLIELLVVIAIIGILSSIVLVSLRNANDKATDARVMSAIAQVRTISTLIYGEENSYSTLCSGATSLNTAHPNYDTELATLNNEINLRDGAATYACQDATTSFCVQATLNTSGFYCADSTGKAGTVSVSTCTSSASGCLGL